LQSHSLKKQLELKKQFEQDGFVVLKAYGAAQLVNIQAAANQELTQLSHPLELEADVQYPGAPVNSSATGGSTPRRLLKSFQRNPTFSGWASNPGLTNTYKCLLNCQQLWLTPNHHNCLMTKLPHFSSDTLWHRDTRYWAFDTPNLLNSWLALGSERLENGGLKVIPGSHKIELEASQLNQDQFLNPDHPKNRLLLTQARPVELEAGDVLLFSAHLIHAASRNLTGEPKLSLVFTYHGEDTKPLPKTRSDALPEIMIK
jgi:phytanoyl-CoA hydroxylase